MNFPGRREREMGKRVIILAAVLFAVSSVSIFSDGSLSMDLSLCNSVARSIDSTETVWLDIPSGAAEISYASTGNANVKSAVSFSLNYPNIQAPASPYAFPLLTVDKLYVKARFPEFRLTAGKTRLSWGDGFLFNAGDILFGSLSTEAINLTADEIRGDTAWLASVNMPFDRFSFGEAVVLFPSDGNQDITGLKAGARVYKTLDSVKLESGYLFDGSAAAHEFYLSLQGNLGADWTLAVSAALPSDGSDLQESFEDSLHITGGLFYLYPVDRIRTLSVRLETLFNPYGTWSESSAQSYALLLYPELGMNLTDTVSAALRAILSPIDQSALCMASLDWNIFQGFTLFSSVTAQVGDSGDLFSWSSTDIGHTSLAVTAGINYIY